MRQSVEIACNEKQKKVLLWLMIPILVVVILFMTRFFYAEAQHGTFGPDWKVITRQLELRIENWNSTPGAPAFFEKEEEIPGAYAVFDIEDEKFLTASDERKLIVPASLTKLFTIDFALQTLKPDEIIEVGEGSLAFVKPGGSVAGIRTGEMPVSVLIQANLIPSGNDASYALAAATGRRLMKDESAPATESIPYFIEALRHYLKEQGYTDTSITDPSGDAEVDYTSIRDLARVAKRVLQYPVVDEAIQTVEFNPSDEYSKAETWITTNTFINPNTNMYDPSITGFKTGTLKGVHNLILRYERKGDAYLLMGLGQKSKSDLYQLMDGLTTEINQAYRSDDVSPIRNVLSMVTGIFRHDK